jgi:hypothetical protein
MYPSLAGLILEPLRTALKRIAINNVQNTRVKECDCFMPPIKPVKSLESNSRIGLLTHLGVR